MLKSKYFELLEQIDNSSELSEEQKQLATLALDQRFENEFVCNDTMYC